MIEDYLCRHATQHPQHPALIAGHCAMDYATLWTTVRAEADRLLQQGLRPGEAHVFRASQGPDCLITYFATHLAGGVAVPLESSLPDTRFHETAAGLTAVPLPPDTADILFTTGTTGQSKGVMLSHDALVANAENLVEAQGFTPDLTFLISGPLNHIGSLSKVWAVLLSGGTLHLTDGLRDASAFFAAMDRPRSRFATFLVPTALRMLMSLSADALQRRAGVIDFIETGAAPMAQADMEQLCRLLPHSRLFNTYASTETGILCTHNYNSDLCLAGCLGRPMKHSRIFITPEGTVACQGRTLMSGYVGDPVLTASVLHDHTLFTHDHGRIDSAGRLHLSGRTDDVINIGGFKIAPTEVEAAALTLPSISDCICIAARHPVMGLALKLLIVPAPGSPPRFKDIALHLRTRLEAYKVPALYEVVESIQRNKNGKIDRKAYRE